jgi:DNA-binding CsgD family transcriptional regulator
LALLTRAPRASFAYQTLLEREEERRAIGDSLERLGSGEGSALLIEGEAGIGKSTLLEHAAGEALRSGFRVVRARGGELERDVPYGIATELFSGLVRQSEASERLFAGPASLTAGLFGGRALPGLGRTADPPALLHGLFWLVLNVVEDEPLVLLVDDAQWADEPSMRLLLHIAQRIDELPVIVLVAMRAVANAGWTPPAAALRASKTATHLQPAPLTEAGVGELLARSGVAPDDAVRQACWQATRGNPFYVSELAAAIRADAGALTDPEAVRTLVPERVGRAIAARLAGLEPAARRVAEAAAILGDSASVSRCRALAGVATDDIERAIRGLVAGAILEDAPTVSFRHPIVAGSVYASIPGPVRAALHRDAALLLAKERADLAEVAVQLREAEACGDRRIVELLLAAAEEATNRGEPGVAVVLLRRALAEPPALDQRRTVLTHLAAAEASFGAPTAAETYHAAIELEESAPAKVALQLELGHALIASGQWAEARDVFREGLAETDVADPDLRARLEAGYLSAGWVTMGDRLDIEERVRRILDAKELGAANRELAVWVAFQQGATIGSTAPEMAALVKRAIAEAPLEVLTTERQVVEVGAGVLLESDELEYEVEFLTRAIDVARRTGPIGKAGTYAYCRAWPNYYMGRLSEAIADTDEARRAAELGWETFLPAAATVAAMAHIERGDLAAAGLALAIEPERWVHRIDGAMLLPMAIGRLALARGDVAAAVEHIRQARAGAASAFMRNSVPTDWRAWLATALHTGGERDEARALASEGIEIARAWGARWPLGAATRVAGLVTGGADGIDLLRESERLLGAGPARLEHARALVDLGAALRRHGSLIDARKVLARAADLARRLGARALADRALDELRAAGARPRRLALTGVQSLTPAELRVAREAAAGRTNREVAQALFVTPKAVEFHLANAYRKLHIQSRGELTAALRAAQ